MKKHTEPECWDAAVNISMAAMLLVSSISFVEAYYKVTGQESDIGCELFFCMEKNISKSMNLTNDQYEKLFNRTRNRTYVTISGKTYVFTR